MPLLPKQYTGSSLNITVRGKKQGLQYINILKLVRKSLGPNIIPRPVVRDSLGGEELSLNQNIHNFTNKVHKRFTIFRERFAILRKKNQPPSHSF